MSVNRQVKPAKSEVKSHLNIHGRDYQNFELTGPYMISYEVLDEEQDFFEYQLFGPSFKKQETICLSEHPEYVNRPKHQHEFYELMVVLSGRVKQNIEGSIYEYSVGQCCLLNHHIHHAEIFCGTSEILFLMISDSFIHKFLHHNLKTESAGDNIHLEGSFCSFVNWKPDETSSYSKQYIDFLPITPPSDLMGNTLMGIVNETSQMLPGFLRIVEALFFRFFNCLYDPHLYYRRTIETDGGHEEYLFIRIHHLLEKHKGNLSREEISAKMKYNPSYLNRIVNSRTGLSLLSYARLLSLREAAFLLVQSDSDIASIIYQLGFSNRSYFYRLFHKQYGMTPNEYRTAYRGLSQN